MPQKDNSITFGNQTFTTSDIMDKVGCCRTTATKRIINCKSKDALLASIKSSSRKFIIAGVEITVEEVMDKVGCCKNTAYARLNSCDTLEHLYRPLSKFNSGKSSAVSSDDENLNKLLFGKW